MGHLPCVVAGSGGGVFRDGLFNCLEVFGAELEFKRAEAFLELVALAGTNEGDDVSTLCGNPGDGHLRHSGTLGFGYFSQDFHQRQVPVDIFLLEARAIGPEILAGFLTLVANDR